MSESHKGKKGLCGVDNPMYGKHFTSKHKKRISEKLKGRVPWHSGRNLKDDPKYVEMYKKRSVSNKGDQNPNSKSISINGVVYNCKMDAVTDLGVSIYLLNKKLNSIDEPFYITLGVQNHNP